MQSFEILMEDYGKKCLKMSKTKRENFTMTRKPEIDMEISCMLSKLVNIPRGLSLTIDIVHIGITAWRSQRAAPRIRRRQNRHFVPLQNEKLQRTKSIKTNNSHLLILQRII